MAAFISNPIALGVRSSSTDIAGGPLNTEIIAGAGIAVALVDTGGGDTKIRITATGGSVSTFTDIVDPTADNDSIDTAGVGRTFDVGDHWINIATDSVFVNVDSTPTAAIWQVLDTTAYLQEDFADNTTKQIVLGDKDDFEAFFISYYLTAATVSKTRTGFMYVTHNDTIADLRDEFVEVNGSMDIDPVVVIAAGDIRLDLTAVSVGSALKFRYTVAQITPVI